ISLKYMLFIEQITHSILSLFYSIALTYNKKTLHTSLSRTPNQFIQLILRNRKCRLIRRILSFYLLYFTHSKMLQKKLQLFAQIIGIMLFQLLNNFIPKMSFY